MERVEVSADALRQVLQALVVPGYMVMELKATMSLDNNAVNKLIDEYNAAITKGNQ